MQTESPSTTAPHQPEARAGAESDDVRDSELYRSIQRLAKGLRDAVLIIDRRHRLLWMNDASETLTGAVSASCVGRRCYEVMRCAGASGVRACTRLCRSKDRIRRSVIGRDGSCIPVLADRLPLGHQQEGCAAIVCSLVPDKADTDLDRTRTEFLSNVTHELRTPLTSLAASIELLMNCDEGIPEDVGAVLRVMHRSTLWLHNLVENLLCASSIQMGRFQIDPQPTSLQEVIDEALAFAMPLLEKKGQDLKYVFPPTMGEVMADAQRISQVLINLLHNASKYGPVRDQVELRVDDEGGEYRISVSEHGPGIPPSECQLLFERFYRRRPSDGEGKPGIGLGLAIVRSIVELHGGRVGVHSVVGRGSTFWFSLPKPSASEPGRVCDLGQPSVPEEALS